MTELRLSDNPAWEGDRGNTKGDKHDDLQRARFICPVVGLEMNGRHRWVSVKDVGTERVVLEPGNHTGSRGRPPVRGLHTLPAICTVGSKSTLIFVVCGLLFSRAGEPEAKRDFTDFSHVASEVGWLPDLFLQERNKEQMFPIKQPISLSLLETTQWKQCYRTCG